MTLQSIIAADPAALVPSDDSNAAPSHGVRVFGHYGVNGLERAARDEALASLASRTKSELITRIGHVAVLYRRDAEKPRIVLPA